MTITMNLKTGDMTDGNGCTVHIGKNCHTVYCKSCKIAFGPAGYRIPCFKCGGETVPVMFIDTTPYLLIKSTNQNDRWTMELEALDGPLEIIADRYGWINTGIKPNLGCRMTMLGGYEDIEDARYRTLPGIKTTDTGMRFDSPYLYQPPKPVPEGHWTSDGHAGGVPIPKVDTTVPQEFNRVKDMHSMVLNKKTGECTRFYNGKPVEPRPFKAEPSPMPVCDNVMEDGSVLIKKENVPKRLWKKVFGLSDAEGRKG